MFVEKISPLPRPKSSVGAICFGGISLFIAGNKHVAPTELLEGISLAFPMLQTCHSYGVYEEYFMLIA